MAKAKKESGNGSASALAQLEPRVRAAVVEEVLVAVRQAVSESFDKWLKNNAAQRSEVANG